VDLPSEVTLELAGPVELRADSSFWRLYEASFGPAEREPQDVILRSLEVGAGLAVRARRFGHTMGLATAHVLDNLGVTFLVYLAVDSEWRSKGLGAALFDLVDATGVARLARQGSSPAGIVWELDDPNTGSDEVESEIRRARMRFFEKLGGRLLDVPYVQPPVDGHTLVPMRLMFRPSTGEALPDHAASAALVRAMYFQKYQAINGIPTELLEGLAAGLSAAEPDKL
jgi:hypothetical protein